MSGTCCVNVGKPECRCAELRRSLTPAPAPAPEGVTLTEGELDILETGFMMANRCELDDDADAPIRRAVSLILAARQAPTTEAAAWAAAAADHNVARIEDLRGLLAMVKDRLDEFTYDELASIIEDDPLDQWGDAYRSRLAAALDQTPAEQAPTVALDVETVTKALHAFCEVEDGCVGTCNTLAAAVVAADPRRTVAQAQAEVLREAAADFRRAWPTYPDEWLDARAARIEGKA